MKNPGALKVIHQLLTRLPSLQRRQKSCESSAHPAYYVRIGPQLNA